MAPSGADGLILNGGSRMATGAADAAGEAAARRRCLAISRTFDARAADVAERRAVARCVDLVHGLSDRAPAPVWPLVLAVALGAGAGYAAARRQGLRHAERLVAVLFGGMAGVLIAQFARVAARAAGVA